MREVLITQLNYVAEVPTIISLCTPHRQHAPGQTVYTTSHSY